MLSEQELDKLYSWIDHIKLSRPKKNMARDFSDGLLLSEILNNFYPKLIDQHIFFDRNSFESKKK